MSVCVCFHTKSSGRPQQLQLCRRPVPCSRCGYRESPVTWLPDDYVSVKSVCLWYVFIELERQRAALYSQRRRNRRLVEPFLTPGCGRHGPLWTGSMRLGRVIVRETFKDTRGFAHRIGAYRGPSAILAPSALAVPPLCFIGAAAHGAV